MDVQRSPNEQLTKLIRFCGKTLHHRLGGRCSQDRILMMLDRHGKMTQKEMMDAIGIQSGSLSEVTGKLEESGFICRVKNEQDKRILDIMLTEAGTAEAQRVRRRREALEEQLYAPLSGEEKAQLTALLGKLADAWKQDERR